MRSISEEMRDREKEGNESDTHTTTGGEKQIYTVKQVLNNHLTHTVFFFLSEHQRLGQITNDKTKTTIVSI